MSEPVQPTVAVVDDDPIFQFTAMRTLQNVKLATPVMQFSNGREILNYLRDHAEDPAHLPDIIFLDINMPLMDGWMFLDDFHTVRESLAKPITIYMVSSSIDMRDIDKARENPLVADYVVKPVSPERFSELLRIV
ncbi:MAG: response regulator [Cyclobacteriaceae bacterium]|jgi:CheY-like chemotaxis protein|nr:response regulator [Cyclobacteriaceae bacterium]